MVRLGRRAALLWGAASLGACALPRREPAVPKADTRRARVLGVPNERFMLEDVRTGLAAEFASAMERRRAHLGLPPGASLPALDMLAVSGGGEDGAFGAGLLTG